MRRPARSPAWWRLRPAAGFVDAKAAIIIGAGAGVVCYSPSQLKSRLRVDDALDVWAVHGVGGWWGAIATGLFATVAVNAGGANGLFFGNPAQLGIQLIGVLASSALCRRRDLAHSQAGGPAGRPARARRREEIRGLDTTQHGEPAYGI